jgi:2-polyprenyl-3-methyl-5-hydroxy-6-metoxy-1,4-benzoquinol methylase
MKYDPIKKSLGKVFNKTPILRIFFYKLLDLLFLRAWYLKKELKKWAKKHPDKAYILDAGAGFGQYDYYTSRLNKNYKILGVDLKTEQIDDCNNFFKKINESHRISFQFADLTKFVEKEKFDLILCSEVMEHIEDDITVLQNFHSSLKTGGTLLISTPSDMADAHDHDDHNEKKQSNEEKHFFVDEHVRIGYSPEEITQKLKKAGFTNISAKYTYGTPGYIAWILSMKIPIIALNITQLFFILLPFYYIITYPFSFILNWIDTLSEHKKGTGLIVKASK